MSKSDASQERALERLARDIRACRHCRDGVPDNPLPHEPRPVFRVSATARIVVCGQAPGTRVHASGVPFTDPSGVRLREWMGVTEAEFYDDARVAVVPMGFCFPGQNAKGSDLPPRRECAPIWRDRLLAALPRIELMLLAGQYTHRWHVGADCGSLTETVARWREIMERSSSGPRMIPLPHPSWRNNAWLKKNPWFAADLLPVLKREVRRLL